MPSFLNFFFFPFFKGGGRAGKEGEASPPHPTPHPAYPLTKARVCYTVTGCTTLSHLAGVCNI